MSLIRQIMQDTPAGYWPFNVDYKDISGNGLDGTATNGASLTTLSPFGTVADINASTQSVNTADATGLRFDGTVVSIEVWANLDAMRSSDYLGSKVPAFGGGTHEWILYSNAAGAGPQLWLSQNGGGNQFCAATSSDGPLTTGRWYHIVGTYSGAATHTATIYINGVQKGQSASTSGGASAGISSGVRWGSYNPTDTSGDVKLAHCAIFNSELSAARVKAHYEAGRRYGVTV